MAKKRGKSDGRLKNKPADDCLDCRMADWKSNFCLKLRIDIDKAAPVSGCDYWRKPLEV